MHGVKIEGDVNISVANCFSCSTDRCVYFNEITTKHTFLFMSDVQQL